MRMRTRGPRLALGALLALLLCGSAWAAPQAGGFTVSPVRLDLAPGAHAVSLTLSNGADRIKTIQVEAFRWTQVNGEDHYEPAPELIVNPPLFRVTPGSRQVVRAGFAAGAPALDLEQAYRVYLQEIPDGEEPPPNQLRLLLRIGVPLFVAPTGDGEARPAWALSRQADGTLALGVRNDGPRRLRIEELEVHADDGTSRAVAGLSYVLAGQSRTWSLPAIGQQGALHLAGISDGGPVDVALPVP